MDTVIAAPASCEVRAVIRFLHAEEQSAAAAMTVSMFYQYLLLHYAAKIYEGTRTARTEFPCYYWACSLTLWQRVYFYQPIGGWFWNNPRIYAVLLMVLAIKVNYFPIDCVSVCLYNVYRQFSVRYEINSCI
jgi:hypothetical protein